jgi:hypothetical protein
MKFEANIFLPHIQFTRITLHVLASSDRNANLTFIYCEQIDIALLASEKNNPCFHAAVTL